MFIIFREKRMRQLVHNNGVQWAAIFVDHILSFVSTKVSKDFSEFFEWGKRMNRDTGVFRIFKKTLGKCESYSAKCLKCNFISSVKIWKQRPSKHLKTLTFHELRNFWD